MGDEDAADDVHKWPMRPGVTMTSEEGTLRILRSYAVSDVQEDDA